MNQSDSSMIRFDEARSNLERLAKEKFPEMSVFGRGLFSTVGALEFQNNPHQLLRTIVCPECETPASGENCISNRGQKEV